MPRKKKGFTQLVYKSPHGDIPIKIRDYVPDGKLLIAKNDGLYVFDINTGDFKKLKGSQSKTISVLAKMVFDNFILYRPTFLG